MSSRHRRRPARLLCYTIGMLSSIQRIRLYGIIVTAFVLLSGLLMNLSARAKYADIVTLNEVRSFANAAEWYKQDIWQYPAGDRIDLRNAFVLSERGFANGQTVYYSGNIPSNRAVIYRSDGTGYTISFTLRQAWPGEKLPSRKCIMSTFTKLTCADDEKEKQGT